MSRLASVAVVVLLSTVLTFVSEASAQNLYYAARPMGTVWQVIRTNLDGSNPKVIMTQQDVVVFGDSIGVALEGPWFAGLAVDPVGGKLYWATDVTGGGVEREKYVLRSDMDGSNIEVVIEPPNAFSTQSPLVIYRPAVPVPAIGNGGLGILVAPIAAAGGRVLSRRPHLLMR